MRILALNGASANAGAGLALLQDASISVLERWTEGGGAATGLPSLLAAALDAAGWPPGSLDLIAVLAGPGSFTGLRASLALAHGLALARGTPVIGVTVGEALSPAVRGLGGARTVWCVSQARRDRIFIETITDDGSVAPPAACMLDRLPDPGTPLALAGDARDPVAAALALRGVAPILGSIPGSILGPILGPIRPTFAAIAGAALRRHAGTLAPLPAQPLYIDPPEARLPAARA